MRQIILFYLLLVSVIGCRKPASTKAVAAPPPVKKSAVLFHRVEYDERRGNFTYDMPEGKWIYAPVLCYNGPEEKYELGENCLHLVPKNDFIVAAMKWKDGDSHNAQVTARPMAKCGAQGFSFASIDHKDWPLTQYMTWPPDVWRQVDTDRADYGSSDCDGAYPSIEQEIVRAMKAKIPFSSLRVNSLDIDVTGDGKKECIIDVDYRLENEDDEADALVPLESFGMFLYQKFPQPKLTVLGIYKDDIPYYQGRIDFAQNGDYIYWFSHPGGVTGEKFTFERFNGEKFVPIGHFKTCNETSKTKLPNKKEIEEFYKTQSP